MHQSGSKLPKHPSASLPPPAPLAGIMKFAQLAQPPPKKLALLPQGLAQLPKSAAGVRVG